MSRKYLVVLALTSLLLLFLSESISSAAILGNVNASTSITSGSWLATVNSATGNSVAAPYVTGWTGNNKKQDILIALINSGSLDLIGGHFNFSSAKPNGDTTNAPTLTFDTCTGVWDPTTFICSGTTMTVGNGTSGTVNIAQPIPVGGRVIIHITNARNNSANFNTTLSSFLTRSDIRTGVVINS